MEETLAVETVTMELHIMDPLTIEPEHSLSHP